MCSYLYIWYIWPFSPPVPFLSCFSSERKEQKRKKRKWRERDFVTCKLSYGQYESSPFPIPCPYSPSHSTSSPPPSPLPPKIVAICFVSAILAMTVTENTYETRWAQMYFVFQIFISGSNYVSSRLLFRNVLYVIDWKTSSKPKPLLSNLFDNPLQVAAYLGAVNFSAEFTSKVMLIKLCKLCSRYIL